KHHAVVDAGFGRTAEGGPGNGAAGSGALGQEIGDGAGERALARTAFPDDGELFARSERKGNIGESRSELAQIGEGDRLEVEQGTHALCSRRESMAERPSPKR